MYQEETESRKSRAGRDRPFCHPAPISLSNSSHPCHCHHTGLCANPAPLSTAVLQPPTLVCLPTSSGLSSNAAIPFMAFPYEPCYVKWYYLVPLSLLQNSRLLLCFAPYNQIHIYSCSLFVSHHYKVRPLRTEVFHSFTAAAQHLGLTDIP